MITVLSHQDWLFFKALSSAASILTSGAERLRKSQEAAAKRTTPNFHYELLKLRSKWRLKKVGNTILGDLSFKSGGSKHMNQLCIYIRDIFTIADIYWRVQGSQNFSKRHPPMGKWHGHFQSPAFLHHFANLLSNILTYWQRKEKMLFPTLFCLILFSQKTRHQNY